MVGWHSSSVCAVGLLRALRPCGVFLRVSPSGKKPPVPWREGYPCHLSALGKEVPLWAGKNRRLQS